MLHFFCSIIFILVVHGTTYSAGSYVEYILSSSPSAFWAFEASEIGSGTVRDLSGNGHDLTASPNGGAAAVLATDLTTSRPGLDGWTGSAHGRTRGDLGWFRTIDNVNVTGVTGYSVSAMFSADSFDKTIPLISDRRPPDDFFFMVYLQSPGVVRAHYSQKCAILGHPSWCDSNVLINAGTTYHLVITFDLLASVMSIFIDGVSQGICESTCGPTIDWSGGVPLTVGQDFFEDANNNTLRLDGMALFDRPLTAGEVARLYQSPGQRCPAGQVLYAPLADGIDETGDTTGYRYPLMDGDADLAPRLSLFASLPAAPATPPALARRSSVAGPFTGSYNKIVIDTAQSTVPQSRVSVGLWIHRTAAVAARLFDIVQYNAPAGEHVLSLQIVADGSLEVRANGACVGQTGPVVSALNQWFHVAVSRDSDQVRVHVVNPVAPVFDPPVDFSVGLSADLCTTTAAAAPTGPMMPSGRITLLSDATFEGYIADFRIWDRVLTFADLLAIRNNDCSVPEPVRRTSVTGRRCADAAFLFRDQSVFDDADYTALPAAAMLANGADWGSNGTTVELLDPAGWGFVELDVSPLFRPTPATEFTVELFFERRSSDNLTEQVLFSLFSGSGGFVKAAAAPLLSFRLVPGSLVLDFPVASGTPDVTLSLPGVFPSDRYSYVAVSYAADGLRVWHEGGGSRFAAATLPPFAADLLRIGGDPTVGVANSHLVVDSVRIHLRALNASDVQLAHAAGADAVDCGIALNPHPCGQFRYSFGPGNSSGTGTRAIVNRNGPLFSYRYGGSSSVSHTADTQVRCFGDLGTSAGAQDQLSDCQVSVDASGSVSFPRDHAHTFSGSYAIETWLFIDVDETGTNLLDNIVMQWGNANDNLLGFYASSSTCAGNGAAWVRLVAGYTQSFCYPSRLYGHTWYQVALTESRTPYADPDTIAIYLDGVRIARFSGAQQPVGSAVLDPAVSQLSGVVAPVNPVWWRLDELRLHTSSLSPEQIDRSYDAGRDDYMCGALPASPPPPPPASASASPSTFAVASTTSTSFAVSLLDEQAAPSGQRFGASVVSLGDVDGNGAVDFAVGRPGANLGQDAGSVVVVLMDASGQAAASTVVLDEQSFPSSLSLAAGDEFGRSLALVGDWNGDGVASDFVVGAPGTDGGLGAVYVVCLDRTGASLPPPTGFVKLSSASGYKAALEPGGRWGTAVASGQLNGDSVPDLVVGSRGAVDLMFMHSFGFVAGEQKLTAADVADADQDLASSFGTALALHDDGDRRLLAVGASGNQTTNGAVFLVPLGFDTAPAQFPAPLSASVARLDGPVAAASARFGASLAFSLGVSPAVPVDLLVGAPDLAGGRGLLYVQPLTATLSLAPAPEAVWPGARSWPWYLPDARFGSAVCTVWPDNATFAESPVHRQLAVAAAGVQGGSAAGAVALVTLDASTAAPTPQPTAQPTPQPTTPAPTPQPTTPAPTAPVCGPTSCAANAVCGMVAGAVQCACPTGFIGNGVRQCLAVADTPPPVIGGGGGPLTLESPMHVPMGTVLTVTGSAAALLGNATARTGYQQFLASEFPVLVDGGGAPLTAVSLGVVSGIVSVTLDPPLTAPPPNNTLIPVMLGRRPSSRKKRSDEAASWAAAASSFAQFNLTRASARIAGLNLFTSRSLSFRLRLVQDVGTTVANEVRVFIKVVSRVLTIAEPIVIDSGNGPVSASLFSSTPTLPLPAPSPASSYNGTATGPNEVAGSTEALPLTGTVISVRFESPEEPPSPVLDSGDELVPVSPGGGGGGGDAETGEPDAADLPAPPPLQVIGDVSIAPGDTLLLIAEDVARLPKIEITGSMNMENASLVLDMPAVAKNRSSTQASALALQSIQATENVILTGARLSLRVPDLILGQSGGAVLMEVTSDEFVAGYFEELYFVDNPFGNPATDCDAKLPAQEGSGGLPLRVVLRRRRVTPDTLDTFPKLFDCLPRVNRALLNGAAVDRQPMIAVMMALILTFTFC